MTQGNKSTAGAAAPNPPQAASAIERTFGSLVTSHRPNAVAAISFAVLNSTGEPLRIAVSAALDRKEREALEAVIRIFHTIPPDLQAAAISRAEDVLSVLRTSIRDGERQTRINSCDFLIRMDDPRVAYLLADLLQDPVEDIKKKAQEGILGFAHTYHAFAADVERGRAQASRQVVETKRYALLDALLTALRFYKAHERPEIIAALLSLDPRGDEVLMDILANPMDRRRKIILDILETASYSRAVSFVLSMLKNPKAASLAVEILETRFDMDFLKNLLAAPMLFANARVATALGQVQFIPWLRPGVEKVSQLPERLAVRAVRFLLYTGAKPPEKIAALEKHTSSPNVALASAARFVVSAIGRGMHPDKIDAGLVKIEEHCPEVAFEAVEPRIEDLIVKKTEAPARGARFLSDEAVFRNFTSSFDTSTKSEKDSILAEFRAKGILARELKKALGDAEPDVVLRSIKVVEYVACQADVTTELILLTKHADGRVRSAAVRQLGKSGAYDAFKALFSALSDRDRRVLSNAVEALESTGNKQVMRLLDPMMKHPDNRVRATAAKAAWTLGSEQGRTCLIDMLKNTKPNMRLSGLWGLRQIGAKDQIPVIREIAKSDPDEGVRKAAELTIAELENVL